MKLKTRLQSDRSLHTVSWTRALAQASRVARVSLTMAISLLVNVPVGYAANCTLTQGYWKNHPEAWPTASLSLAGVVYDQAQALAILDTSPAGDATYILAHQLVAATLNVLAGADATDISAAIEASNQWLVSYPLGSSPRGSERSEGVALAAVLDDYNNGILGPGHCEDPADPTPTADATPSTTQSPEATTTSTADATPSATPTSTADATPSITQSPESTPTATAEATPSVTQPPVSTPTAIGATGACPAQPADGCRVPVQSGKATLYIRNLAVDEGDKLTWKWKLGEATSYADLGDPIHSTAYTLCVYDQAGGSPDLTLSLTAPGGTKCGGTEQPCWKQSSKGLIYRDKSFGNAGIKKIQLNAGADGQAKILFLGVGPNLRLSDTLAERRGLPEPMVQDSSIVVQLWNSNGVCWSASYSTPAKQNWFGVFKDRAD